MAKVTTEEEAVSKLTAKEESMANAIRELRQSDIGRDSSCVDARGMMRGRPLFEFTVSLANDKLYLDWSDDAEMYVLRSVNTSRNKNRVLAKTATCDDIADLLLKHIKQILDKWTR